MTATQKTMWEVTFVNPDGSEDRYAERTTEAGARQAMTTAKRSPRRKGRPVALSRVEYARDEPGYLWTRDGSYFVQIDDE